MYVEPALFRLTCPVVLQECWYGQTYAAVQELRLMTSGCCTPTLATVYPLLAEMERRGYLESQPEFTGGRRRRVYRLTPRGEQAYQAAVAAWAEVVPLVQRALQGEQQTAVHSGQPLRPPRGPATLADDSGTPRR